MVLQDAGAPVWVMSHAHLSLGMVLLHAVFVVFETTVLVIVARSLDGVRDAAPPPRCAPTTPPSAPSWPLLADALERRDLSVAGDVPATAPPRSCAAASATSPRWSRRSSRPPLDITQTSHEVSAASADSERSSTEIAGAVTSVAAATEQQARLVTEAGDAAGEAAAAVERALHAAEAAAEAAAAALADAERGMSTADDARVAMTRRRGVRRRDHRGLRGARRAARRRSPASWARSRRSPSRRTCWR